MTTWFMDDPKMYVLVLQNFAKVRSSVDYLDKLRKVSRGFPSGKIEHQIAVSVKEHPPWGFGIS